MKLSGKVALVVPGTYGVGHDAAIIFASEGARVVVGGADEENGRKTVEAVSRAGGEAHFVPCDLMREAEVERLVETTLERCGALDVAFGCPDYYLPGLLLDQTAAQFDYTMWYTCRSLFFLSKYAIPRMVERAGGSLIFLTSVYGFVSGSVSCAYEVAKGTVMNMTRTLAERYAGRRVRVNCIAAGHIVEAPRDLKDELPLYVVRDAAEVERLSKFYPLGRLALNEEIARAAAFLGSDDSSYTTGSVLSLDGGFVCR